MLGVIAIAGFMAQSSSAQTEVIEEKNLVQAHKNLKEGNVTAAVSNILTILDWEFKEIHPRLAKQFEAENRTVTSQAGTSGAMANASSMK
jgi:hypothetical protein